MNDELPGKDHQSIGADQTNLETTGRALNERWGVNASHALYHHEGRWYHKLNRFPGALFDRNGYVVFETKDEFNDSAHLAITQDVHVAGGISSIPGYKRGHTQAGE